jgi:hypothetical protein
MAQSRTGRDWLCDTEEVTDTRHWEPRAGVGPFALTAAGMGAVSGECLARRPRSIVGVAVHSRRAGGRDRRLVRSLGAECGGWTVGADAPGGSRRTGEEVR